MRALIIFIVFFYSNSWAIHFFVGFDNLNGPPGGDSKQFDESATPEVDEDTPVVHETLEDSDKDHQERPWRPPTFTGQEKALGYKTGVFDVPPGLEKQVNFWIDIYTKYTTNQGVIHDSESIDTVYEVVDFNDIESNSSLTEFQKSKARRKRVDNLKKQVVERLKYLQNISGPEGLAGDDLRYWKYFEKSTEPEKFVAASEKGRLRFQLGQKDRMQKGIYLSGRYLEHFERIFKDQGLPLELTRLAFVESSFNVFARSKVGASGLWQIMPYTGRPYRMISPTVDKRNDPVEATRLAAKLLAMNFGMLDSWPLAITGYNHGPAGVKRMTQKYNTTSIVDLIQNVKSSKTFGFASRNFYASFLAALTVEKNADKYFQRPQWGVPFGSYDVVLEKPVTYKQILKWFDLDDKRTQLYNPHISMAARRFGKALPAKTLVRFPKDKEDVVKAELYKKSPIHDAERSVANHGQVYEVAPGDTLDGIAKSFGVKVADLLTENDSLEPHRLKAGQKIKIP